MTDQEPGEPSPSPEQPGTHLEAHVSGGGSSYQAGRDQHLHFQDGTLRATRVEGHTVETVCPYPGLAPFGPEQARWFFGRDQILAIVCERLAEKLSQSGPLMVIGPSGGGKSSLLHAGVVPALDRGVLPVAGSRRWPLALLTPTAHPMREWERWASTVTGRDANSRDASNMTEMWPADLEQCLQSLRGAVTPNVDESGPPGRVIVLIDQFEEIFTLCTDELERRTFIDLLTRMATPPADGGDPLGLVLICVRADFYDACLNYSSLRAALRTNPVLLEPMSGTELREAILYPAQAVGLEVEPGLTEVLLRDIGMLGHGSRPGDAEDPRHWAGRLPLLAHALRVTWQQRRGHILTVDGYRLTGGIQHAIATTAEYLFTSLELQGQQVARTLFLRLVKIGDNTDDTRRHVSRQDLVRDFPDPQSVIPIMDAFTRARLLTQERDTVTITHEALLDAWPRLRGWIDADRAGNLIRQELEDAAATWDRNSGETSALYRGNRLEIASGWADGHDQDITPTARDFLTQSRQHQRRVVQLRRGAVAILVALTLIAITAAGIAVHYAASATRQHAIALSRQLTAEALAIDPTQPVIARRLALAAWRVFPTDQARSLITTLVTEQQQDGILPAAPSLVSDVAFSPDGRLLATADGDGTVRLWDPATGQPVGAPLHASRIGGVNGVAFSPDGRLLATADGDGTVRLWDPATGQPAGAPLHASRTGRVNGVAFSPDGRLLATADVDGTLRLWDAATGQPRGAPVHAAPSALGVNGVAFSPDGRLLATADGDATVRLWNAATGHPVGAPLHAGPHGVNGVAFSPDGKLLATAGGDGTVRLWNPATGQPRGAPLLAAEASTGGVNRVAFSPNGKLLASAGSDGTVRLWDPATGQPRGAPLHAHSGGVDGVAFSPDGKLLATAGGYGTVRLWDPATGQPRGAPLHTHSGAVNGVAFSPDGKLLATADSDGTVRLWDPATGQSVGAPLPAGTSHSDAVNGVAFSPDGKLLASVIYDAWGQLWDPATDRPLGAPLHVTGRFTAVRGVAFSPDGKLLATADSDGTVRLWDPATGRPVGTPMHAGRSTSVDEVAFSPNGKLLASADDDVDMVQLWDPTNAQPVGAPLHANRIGGLGGVAFSPGGKVLATAGVGAVQLWDVSLFEHPLSALCADVGPPTQRDWDQYAHGEPLPKVCS